MLIEDLRVDGSPEACGPLASAANGFPAVADFKKRENNKARMIDTTPVLTCLRLPKRWGHLLVHFGLNLGSLG